MPDEKTGTPGAAAGTGAAPAAAAPRDTYGDKKVDFSKIPVAGYQKGNKFVPAGEGEGAGDPNPNPEPNIKDDASATGDPDTTGQPGEGEDPKPDTVTVLKAKNGKTFKDASEILAAYDASSPEAERLAKENKTFKLTVDDISRKVEEANQTIIKMQEYIANSAYQPNVPEKYKGMTESEMLTAMTEDEKLDYKLDKREWSKKVEAFKSQVSAAKAEAENIAKETKIAMDRAEQTMLQDKTNYPDFEELGPLRAEILKESPHLGNRPDAHYISYLMAHGIVALKEREETARLEAKSRDEAARKAGGAAANGGGTGSGGHEKGAKPKEKDTVLSGIVKAGKAMKGSF